MFSREKSAFNVPEGTVPPAGRHELCNATLLMTRSSTCVFKCYMHADIYSFFFFFFSPMIVCAVQMVDSFVQVQNMCSAWSRIVAVVF